MRVEILFYRIITNTCSFVKWISQLFPKLVDCAAPYPKPDKRPVLRYNRATCVISTTNVKKTPWVMSEACANEEEQMKFWVA